MATKEQSATKIFQKNLTSRLLVEALLKIDMLPEARCLDLGCGDGNIILEVAQKSGLTKVFGSDVSEIAIDQACDNALSSNIESDFRCGASFLPWNDQSFEVICCDVAAISQTIAGISDWYDGVDCETGEDGLDLVAPIIEQAKNHLTKDGSFIIPTISLANEVRLLAILEKNFSQVQLSKKKEWPMPEDIMQKLNNEQLPIACDNWNIREKFGLFVAHTSAYICSDGKGENG